MSEGIKMEKMEHIIKIDEDIKIMMVIPDELTYQEFSVLLERANATVKSLSRLNEKENNMFGTQRVRRKYTKHTDINISSKHHWTTDEMKRYLKIFNEGLDKDKRNEKIYEMFPFTKNQHNNSMLKRVVDFKKRLGIRG